MAGKLPTAVQKGEKEKRRNKVHLKKGDLQLVYKKRIARPYASTTPQVAPAAPHVMCLAPASL